MRNNTEESINVEGFKYIFRKQHEYYKNIEKNEERAKLQGLMIRKLDSCSEEEAIKVIEGFVRYMKRKINVLLGSSTLD